MKFNISGYHTPSGEELESLQESLKEYTSENPSIVSGKVNIFTEEFVYSGKFVKARNVFLAIQTKQTLEEFEAAEQKETSSTDKAKEKEAILKKLYSKGVVKGNGHWLEYEGKKYNGMKALKSEFPDLFED